MLFEIKKFLKSRRNIIAIIFLIVSIIFFAGNSNRIDKQINKSKIANLDIQIEELGREVRILNQENDIYEADILNEIVQVLKKQKDSINRKDNVEYIKSKIEYNEFKIELSDSKYFNNINIDKVLEENEEYEKLIELNIEPIEKEYSMEGYNFLRLILNAPMTLIFSLIIFICNSVSGESENRTYKILLTQPISKAKIIIGKFIGLFAISTTVIIINIGIAFITLSAINGFGNSNYPVKILLGGEETFITIKEFVSHGIIFLIIYILFLCIFSTFISVISNQVSTSISICTIISLSMYLINFKFRVGGLLAKYLPFSLLETSLVYSGQLAIIYSNKDYSIEGSIISSFIIIFILTISTITLFNNKSNYS